MTNALLLADPEPAARATLARRLESEGFEVLGAAPDQAVELAPRADLALVSSSDLCRRLRDGVRPPAERVLPVIVLSPDASAADRVLAFQHGADDVVPAPFHYDELLARIHAVLRRSSAVSRGVVETAGLRVDLRSQQVTVAGEPVRLTAMEFALLARLASEPERVFTKGELLRDVWNLPSRLRTRTVDSHASRLRCKLERPGAGPFVVNKWGVGYRLVGW